MSQKDLQFIERALAHPWMFWVYFWKWPRIVRQACTEYDLLAKERDAAKAAHERSERANKIVRDWIHVTHRLSTTPEAIRAIFAAGKRLSILLVFFVVTNTYGQAPPYLRNQWTTNANPLALKVISTNGVHAATNVWELDFTNTATVTVSAVSNANKVMVSFTGSGSGSSSLTNALLHAGPTNGSVGAQILTSGNNIALATVNDTNREISVVGVVLTNRTISTTSPLTGGGALNQDLTLALSGNLTNWDKLATNVFAPATGGAYIARQDGLGTNANIKALTVRDTLAITNSTGIATLVNGLSSGESTNNWGASNPTNSPYRFTPNRTFNWGLNNANLTGYNPDAISMFFGLESTWFNATLPAASEFYFRTRFTNSVGTLMTPEPWGGTINLGSGEVTLSHRARVINFEADNGMIAAQLSHDGTNNGRFTFQGASLSFVGNTNLWLSYGANNFGVLGNASGGTNYLFEGGTTSEKVLMFTSQNPVGSDLRIGFGMPTRWIRWQGTNANSALHRFEYQDAFEVFQPFSTPPGGSDTHVQYNSSGAFAGNSGFVYNGVGRITISGSGATLVSIDTASTAGNQAFAWGRPNANGIGFYYGTAASPFNANFYKYDVPSAVTTLPLGGLTVSGHLLAAVDNSYDIGASGATRPRNTYVANVNTSASAATAATNRIAITATGYTNTLTVGSVAVNVDVYFDAATAALQDSAGNALHTFQSGTNITAHLKPNWRLVGTTMAGTAIAH